MKRPLTGLVVAYALGIWISSLWEWPVVALMGVTAVWMVVFVTLSRTRWSIAALLGLVFFAGGVQYRHKASFLSPNHVTRVIAWRDQNARIRGRIVTDTGYRDETRSGAPEERLRFELELEAVETGDGWRPTEGRLLVSAQPLGTDSTSALARRDLRYGDEIECSVILRVPAISGNPGMFDLRAWLLRQKIFFTATIRRGDDCVVVARGKGHPLMELSLRLRERFERALWYGLEDEPKMAGVLAGMVIGQRSEIPADTYDDFQRTGVFHIFSVSGLNVALVLGVVVAVLRVARVPRRWSGLLAVPALVLYVLITGARPASVRALLMATLWLGSRAVLRPSDGLNALAAAALVILVWDPFQLFDGGFILSFVAVASLIVLAPVIERGLLPVGATDPMLPEQLVPRWRREAQRAWSWLARGLSCSLAAWIGLLPLMAMYFNLFTPVGIVANVVVIPLLGAITALGMVTMPIHAVCPWLALTFGNANFALLAAMIRSVEFLARISWGYRFVQSPPTWVVAGYYAAGIWLLSIPTSWKRTRWASLTALPIVGTIIWIAALRNEAVELTVLKMEKGASIFLNTPGEKHDWLLDGGGNDDQDRDRILVPFLRAQGVDQLAGVVLTCADRAHALGFSEVADEFPIGEAIHSGVNSRSPFHKQWRDEMQSRGIPLREVQAGDGLLFGGRLRARVLHPQKSGVSNRSDDNSLVLMLEYGTTRVLLISDAGETVEAHLLKSETDLRADVIVKGSHETETSCTDAFLDAVKPSEVVEIMGLRSARRYSVSELRQRLAKRNIRLHSVDESGAVTIRVTPAGHRIRTCLSAKG